MLNRVNRRVNAINPAALVKTVFLAIFPIDRAVWFHSAI